MDALISIRGINPQSNTPPGDHGTGGGRASTVSVTSHDDTAVGDYLLLVASVDWVTSLSAENATGVDDWVLLGAANYGSTKRVGAWLGRVTADGPRTVAARQNGTQVMQVQVWTLDAGGTIVKRDGGTSTTTSINRPYTLNSITTSGDRSLLVVFHSAVQFTQDDVDYATPSPPLIVGSERYWDMHAGQITAYEHRNSSGSTGSRQLTSNIATMWGSVGLMFALRAEPSWVTVDPSPGVARVNGPAPQVVLYDPNVHAYPAAGPVTVHGPDPKIAENARPGAGTITVSGLSPTVAIVVPAPVGVMRVFGPPAFAGGTTAEPGLIQVSGPVPSLAFGGQGAASRVYPIEKPPPPPARVMAQNIQTGEWLHWDLPVDNLSITWTLSGPQGIFGEFPTEIKDLRDLNLEPWGTWIHVEEGGLIRASGILQPGGVDQNERLSLDAAGISAFPHGTPYLGAFTLSGTDPKSGESGVGVGLDPADIVRVIWDEVQRYPDSDLDVTVAGQTDVKIGTPPEDVDFETGEGEAVSFVAGPYSKLDWWEIADCGGEIDRLAKETPFDYVERQAWNSDRTGVDHWIEIGWPRLGRHHNTVRLAQEDNLLAAIGPEEPDDRYASMVVVLGSGEGTARVLGSASRPIGTRIRRVKTIDDKTIRSTTAANARARSELDLCQALQDVSECSISAHHPDAPLGSYDVGDDIPLTGEIPWVGMVNLLQRILDITWTPEADNVKLMLRSASTFTYG